jgi:hypothetical protein
VSVDWFGSDSTRTIAEEWYIVSVFCSNAEAAGRVQQEIQRHFRIGKQPDFTPFILGPDGGSTRFAGLPWNVYAVGKAYRAFPASELENWLRTYARDARLQIVIGRVTGIESLQLTARGTVAGLVGTTSAVAEGVATGVAGVASGAASLAQGIGETAQSAGSFLQGGSALWGPLLIIAIIVLIIIAVVTAPKWLGTAITKAV